MTLLKSINLRSAIILVLQCLAYVFLWRSYSLESESLAFVGDLFFMTAILIGSPYDDIISYTFIIPFTGLMPVSFFRLIYCLLLSTAKLFFIKGRVQPLLYITIVYMTINYGLFNIGTQYATILGFMIYCIVLIYKVDYSKINYLKLALMLLISTIFILILIVTSSSDLELYAESTNAQFKLGEESREIGGAMGVSLYTCTGLACAYVLQRTGNRLVSLFATVSMLFFLVMALFALSRTFFLSLAVAVVLGFVFDGFNIGKTSFAQKIMILILVIVFCSGGYIIYKTFGSELLSMFDKLEDLMESGPGKRRKIWTSVISYLFTHPLDLFFGAGTNMYSEMTRAKGYDFYGFGAHNIFLDAIMSFGLLGLFFLWQLIVFEIDKLKKFLAPLKVKVGMVIFPLSLFFACQLAQGSFRDTQTYLYPLAIILISYGLLPQKQER